MSVGPCPPGRCRPCPWGPRGVSLARIPSFPSLISLDTRTRNTRASFLGRGVCGGPGAPSAAHDGGSPGTTSTPSLLRTQEVGEAASWGDPGGPGSPARGKGSTAGSGTSLSPTSAGYTRHPWSVLATILDQSQPSTYHPGPHGRGGPSGWAPASPRTGVTAQEGGVGASVSGGCQSDRTSLSPLKEHIPDLPASLMRRRLPGQ